MRKAEEDELGDYSHAHCSDSFDDEEPSPPVNTMSTIKATCDSSCEKTAEGSREDCSTVEDGESLACKMSVMMLGSWDKV